MTSLPTGTVTFLFTDIEASTQMLAKAGDRFADPLERHRALITDAVEQAGGHPLATGGDAVFAAFGRASDALAAALAAQRALTCEPWPEEAHIRVRMGIHTGEAALMGSDYVGLAVHEAARIADAGHGEQVLVSRTTADLTAGSRPGDCSLRRLGEYRLKDIPHPVEIFQLLHPALRDEFPDLRTQTLVPTNLPVQLTSFIGRRAELASIDQALQTDRLITLLGPGGVGKTRLALEAASGAGPRFEHGVWLVDLAPLTTGEHVAAAAAAALGAPAPAVSASAGSGSAEATVDTPDERLTAFLAPRTALIVLDNCEHLAEAAGTLADRILRSCPQIRVMATSQRPLDIQGERIQRVAPLAVEPGEGPDEAAELFLERARQHEPAFDPDEADRATITQICHRLDGLPLAIELAAAHVRALSLAEIAARLSDRFAFLATGPRTAVERQQTLRSAIDWGFGLLTDAERTLLSRLAVFSGGFSLEAAEAVCSGGMVDRRDVYRLIASLVDKSFVARIQRGSRARYHLLETIREYGWDKLTAGGAAPEPASDAIRLQREGDVWSFDTPAGTFRLRDMKGLRYLASLVRTPGRDVFVLDLIDLEHGAGAAERATRRAIGGAGTATDSRAVQAYRERLAGLEAELQEARDWNDDARAASIEAEIDGILTELASSVGVGGKLRPAASAVERARMSVTKALRAAIERIGEHDPGLGEDLSASIRTGTRCSFEPVAGSLPWEVDGA